VIDRPAPEHPIALARRGLVMSRPAWIVLFALLACDDSASAPAEDPTAAVAGAPATAPASGAQPSTPVATALPSVHVVATREGPFALEVTPDFEIARAGIEVIALRSDAALARDPRVLAGMKPLVEDIYNPRVSVTAFGGRWPNFAALVARISSYDAEGVFTRTMRWDGERWHRDDPVKGALKRYHVPLGMFEHGTLLTRPSVEHIAPGKRGWLQALQKGQPTALARRLPDGSEHQGPPLPPEEYSRFGVAADGHVFAGVQKIAVWRPGATAWQQADLPDATGGWIEGFHVRGASDVLLFGSQQNDPARSGRLEAYRTAYLARYDGARWTSRTAPACANAIEVFEQAGSDAWALCTDSNDDETRPHPQRELWHAGADMRWHEVRFEVTDDGATVRMTTAPAGATAQPPSTTRPRATDIAATKDGTLWIAVSADDGFSHDEPKRSWLVRAGSPAPVLELPRDLELFASLPS
jgi:hypothetical protein